MGWLSRIFHRNEERDVGGASLSNKEMIIAHVLATHVAWYPLHNGGLEAPKGAREAWIHKMWNSSLDESELILLVADHKSRNLLLGKTWP